MDDMWRQRIRVTWIGLGHLTFGASFMVLAISNAEHSIWSLPQFALGGAIVTQGFLHLSAAWNIQPPADNPFPLGNGIARVGIPLAPTEQGVPDLAAEGLILHQNSPPIVDRKNDVDEANLENEGEAEPANVVSEARPANFVGEESQANVGQAPVPEIIVDEADQEFDVNPANSRVEVSQANDAAESGQVDKVGELGQDTDVVNESGLSKDVGKADPANEVDPANDMDEVNQADSVEDIAKCADKDDSEDEFESEIELPRSITGQSLDIPSMKFIDSSESDCESSY